MFGEQTFAQSRTGLRYSQMRKTKMTGQRDRQTDKHTNRQRKTDR